MLILNDVAAAVLSAASAYGGGLGGQPRAPRAAPITVQFGSYGDGIDGDTYARVKAFVASFADVERSVERPWGREGERDVGVFPKADQEDQVQSAISAMLPARPTRGWNKLIDGAVR